MSAPRKLWPRTRWRRVLVGLGLFLLAAVALAALTPLDEMLVAALLGRLVGADVTIERLSWRLDGSLRAHGVRATLKTDRDPFFGVEAVDVELALLPPRVESIVLVHPRLVVTERSDGRLDLQDLRLGGEHRGRPPALTIEGGALELRGRGPLHDKLGGVLAASASPKLEIERLALEPQEGGGVKVEGTIKVLDLARIHVGGMLEGARLERLDVRLADADGIAIDALAQRMATPAAEWIERNELTGRVAGHLALTWSEGQPRLTADVELLDVAITPEVFPSRVSGVHGWLRLRGRDLELDDLSGRHGDAPVTVSGSVADVPGEAQTHVTVRVDAATIDDELRRSLAKDHVGQEVLAALAPEGRYSATAIVDAHAHAPPHLTLEIDLEDCAGVFHGFADPEGVRHGLPVRVERVRGHVHASAALTRFEHCFGFTRGGARVEASAHQDANGIDGEVYAFDAPIDDELLGALGDSIGPEVGEIVALLGLSGRFDASAQFHQRKGEPLELSITLEPRTIDLCAPAFPYPVRIDGGRVLVEHDGVRIDGLHGAAGTGTVRIEGRVEFTTKGEPHPPLAITVFAQDVPLDQRFFFACHALEDGRIAAAVEERVPEGALDLTMRWSRATAGAPMATELRLAPKDVKLSVAGHSAIATHMGGAITFTRLGEEPWQIDLEKEGGLTGDMVGGTLRLTGRTDSTGAGALRLKGGRVHAGADLRAALAPFAPELAALLASQGVDGRVQAIFAMEFRDGRLTPTHVDVEPDLGEPDETGDAPRGVTIEPPWLPLPLTWLGGAMHCDIDAGRVTFDRLTGRIGDAHLSVDGGSLVLDESGLTTALSAEIEALPFGQWIELVFGSERRRALIPYGPLGRTRVTIRELSFHLPTDGSALDRLSTRGDVDCQGWTFYTGGGLKELTGKLEVLNFNLERKKGGIEDARADGRLTGVTLAVGGLRISGIESDLLLADGRLSVPWLSGDYAGGRLLAERNHFGISLLDEMPFDGRLELDSGDVSRLFGDDTRSLKGLAGRVDAGVGFRGYFRPLLRGGGVTRLEAAGSVKVRDAKLWSIPVFDKLYSRAVLPLVGTTEDESGQSEPPRWTRGEIDFALQGIYVRLSKVELEGEPLVLRGEGTLGPERLAINFYPEVKSGIGWVRDFPILGWIFDFIFGFLERQVGAFRFQGPYASPEVDWDPVSLVPRPDLAIRLERPRTSSRHENANPERF